jgi:hypothetical protein
MSFLPHLQSMYDDSSSSSDESFSDGNVSVDKFNHLPFANDASSSDEDDFTSSDDESDFDDSVLPGPLANLVRESSKKSAGIVVTDEGADGSVIVTDIGNSSLLGTSSALRNALPFETASVYSSSSSSSSSVETFLPNVAAATYDAVSIVSGFTASTGSSASSLSTASSGNTIEIVTANVSAEEQLMVASAEKIVKLRAQLVEAQTALASGGYSVTCPACATTSTTTGGMPPATEVIKSFETVTVEQKEKNQALEASIKKLIETLQRQDQSTNELKQKYEKATAEAETAYKTYDQAKNLYEKAKATGAALSPEKEQEIKAATEAAAAAEQARRQEAERVAAEAAAEQARREETERVAAEAAAAQARREEAERVAAEAAAEQARREEAERVAAEAAAEQARREEAERVAAEAAAAEQARREEAERVAAEAAAAEQARREEAEKLAAETAAAEKARREETAAGLEMKTFAQRLAEKKAILEQQKETAASLQRQIAPPPISEP